ncbi:MAG: DUF4352 domain-containing protein [Acidimicrobiales bacterium]
MTAPEGTVEELECEQHGAPTLLTCAHCGTPLCPRCAVWTEVGQKCATCSGRKAASRSARSRTATFAFIGLAALVLGAGAFYLGSDAFQGSGNSDSSLAATGTPTVGVGEPVTQRGITYVVSKFECGVGSVGPASAGATAAGQFCLLHVTVRNDGGNPVVFPVTQQFLLDDTKRRYTVDPGATIANAVAADRQTTPSVLAGQLNPGAEVSNVYVYDVPAGVEPAAAELHAIQPGSGGGIVRVPDREVLIHLTSST